MTVAEREKTIRKLLLLWTNQNAGITAVLDKAEEAGIDYPKDAIIGFYSSHADFLKSVANQVDHSRFITGKQYDAVRRIIGDDRYKPQFSANFTLPDLPVGFRWVNFPDEGTTPTYNPANYRAVDPDARSAGESTYTIGTLTLDLTPDKEKPWGRLTAEGDELVFYPDRYPTTAIKQAKFAWDAAAKCWRHKGIYPETVEKVIELFGEVIVEDDLEIALAARTELVEMPEDIATHASLFEFQKEATQFLLSSPRCLLGLAPGVGKTITSITAAKKLREEGKISTVGIIAPKSLLSTWQDEIEKWAGEWAIILHDDFGPQPLDGDWFIVNYDKLSRGTVPDEILAADLLIFDETILLSNHSRKKEKGEDGKTRWVFKTKRNQTAFELSRDVEYVWELSGGPTSKFLDDLWAQFHLLDPKRFSSYWRFAEEYCWVQEGPWAKEVTGNKPGASEKIQERYADIYYARSQSQVLDLPDWIFESVEIPMSRKQNAAYLEMEKEWLVNIGTGGATVKLYAPNTLAQRTRLTQLASNPVLAGIGITAISPKWDALKELLTIRPLPAIVWVNFVETAKRVADMVRREGLSAGLLIGDTAAARRAKIVSDFQAGNLDVIIAHPKVGKFGLTLTAARTAIYLEAGPDGDDYYQSLHRVRRIGTTHSPIIVHVKSVKLDGNPTVDHLNFDLLENKADTTFEITTDRLIAYFEGRETL